MPRKSGVIHVTEELALELGPEIRVNAVAPAVVKTKFATALFEGREDEVAATYPLKRLGVPEDIGSVVAFLLSEDAAWITGQTDHDRRRSHADRRRLSPSNAVRPISREEMGRTLCGAGQLTLTADHAALTAATSVLLAP